MFMLANVAPLPEPVVAPPQASFRPGRKTTDILLSKQARSKRPVYGQNLLNGSLPLFMSTVSRILAEGRLTTEGLVLQLHGDEAHRLMT